MAINIKYAILTIPDTSNATYVKEAKKSGF